jgi:hypothetical protein
MKMFTLVTLNHSNLGWIALFHRLNKGILPRMLENAVPRADFTDSTQNTSLPSRV